MAEKKTNEQKGLKNLRIKIIVDTKELEETLEKANRLVELLREAEQIIDSL